MPALASAVVALIFAGSLLFGCGQGVPSPDKAQGVIHRSITKESDGRVEVAKFNKTDGQKQNIHGRYVLEFQAEAIILEDCWAYKDFIPSGGFASFFNVDGVSFATKLSGSDWIGQPIHRSKGDKTPIHGSVTFEKKESGWVAIDYKIRIGAQH